MNVFSTMKRANWVCAIVISMLAASGCRSASPPPSAAAYPTNSVAVGASLEDIDARNRTDIAAQLGRPVAPGPATPAEVAAMSHAGVDSRFIICYINRSTDMNPVTAQDVIYLHDQGVNEQVIQAMLTPGSALSRSEVARSMPPRIFIVGDPWWPYYYPRYAYGYGYGYRCY
jgi:hypothetical protein